MTKRDVNEPGVVPGDLAWTGPVAAPAVTSAVSAASPPPSVLLVEDNAIIAMDTEEMLRSLGVELVVTASTVSQALAAIEEQPPVFALLDVNLGGENCLVVAERLAGSKIPFAFVTGYGDQIAFPAAFADVPIICKPHGIDALRAVLSV